MISVLLTRSASENEFFKQELKLEVDGNNFHFIDCPLIEYEDSKLPLDTIVKYCNIIITSKHAAKILAENYRNFEASTRFWVVGELSAAILQSLSLRVEYTAQNVDDLITQIPENIYDRAIYLSSNEITLELPGKIKRYIIYKVKYKSRLSSNEVTLLKQGVDAIMLYSINSAKTLVKLLELGDLVETLQNATVLSISKKVAKEILPYFKKIIYCKKGEHNKMIELLVSHAANSGKFKEND